MANTKYILEQIKIGGTFEALIAKSNGENVSVNYNGGEMSLAQALTQIHTSVSAAQTSSDVQAAVKAAIDALIDGAPGAYDTLKEIADYIEKHESGDKANKTDLEALQTTVSGIQSSVQALGALANKDKVSENDLDTDLKAKVNAAAEGNHSHDNKAELDKIAEGDVAKWNAKADTAPASESANGLMTSDDKKRLNALRGVRYGATPPADMQDGDLFVRVIEG